MPATPIDADTLRRDVAAVLARYDMTLTAFLAADIDDIDEPELRDLWLMTRSALDRVA